MTYKHKGEYVQDVQVEKCSCIFDTSAIPGGRMPVIQDNCWDVVG